MKLEQRIQRSQKSVGGIIGQVSTISEWEIVYREILAISNAFRDFTNSNLGSRECEFHHELDGSYAKKLNSHLKTSLIS